ncbi:PLDc N-terminal domain-containing protein [Candidatus Poribacteria bacterium]|nr:PLDc N-terminal domain-containing protein [Candidatus Poribacteria bacterium]
MAVVVVAHVLRQRRSPAGAVAWLLVIVLFPYVGVPLYLMFGGRKMQRVADSKANIRLPDSVVRPLPEACLIDRLLRTYGIPGATIGNRVSLCRTGEEGYARLVRIIEEASHSVYVQTYVLQEDEVSREIVDRLARRASEGIRVRLLMDGVGSLHTSRHFLSPLVKLGGKVAFFIPVIHRPFRGRTNLRNHRKIIIADGRCVMAGGANIGEEYIGPTPRTGRWRDLSFVLEGPAVSHYAEIFRSDWEFASGESIGPDSEMACSLPEAAGSVVQVVPSGPDVVGDPLYDAILSAMFAAQKRLWVVTPYFIPDEALLEALTLAVHRGIDVRILVPQKSNHPMADLARGTYLRQVQAAGGKVLLYADGMMHAKVLLMDNELAMIGSANMDIRSLFLDYEVAMFAYGEAEVRATEAWVEATMSNTRSGVKPAGTIRDLCEGVVRLAAPLL